MRALHSRSVQYQRGLSEGPGLRQFGCGGQRVVYNVEVNVAEVDYAFDEFRLGPFGYEHQRVDGAV